ncbi:hypothetical protein HY484_02625 [Candidatus Woesearchaeota archaeon]|nr:hypothetical protein [Candidatus Woesearchaeota archaeon]
MSLPIEQILATASEPIFPYEEKPLPVNFDSECREITRVISDAEKRLVALFPAIDFIWGKEIAYRALCPLQYYFFMNCEWHVSRQYSLFGIEVRKDNTAYTISVCDSENNTNRFFAGLCVGKEERKRIVQETRRRWFREKTRDVEEKYLSGVELFKIRVPYEITNGPNPVFWDKESKVHVFAQYIAAGFYNNWGDAVRKQQSQFFVELFEKLPETLAKEVRVVVQGV